MSELSKALGADGPGRLLLVDGQEFWGTLTQRMKAEFQEWSEATLKASLQRTIAPLGDAELLAAVMLKHAEKVSREHYHWGNEGWAEEMRTARGATRFLLMVFKPRRPDITVANVQALVAADPKAVGAFIKELLEEGKSTPPVV